MPRDHFKQTAFKPYFADFNNNKNHKCKSWLCKFEKFLNKLLGGKKNVL